MILKKGKNKVNGGFTLIELIVAIGFALVVVLMVSVTYVNMVSDREQYRTAAEVENAGYEAMSIITQTVRNATSISSPAVSATSSSLTVAVPTASLSPTVFSLSTSTLSMLQGSTRTSITGSQVTVSAPVFTNLGLASTSGTVRIQFTIAEASYSKVFYGSATIRKFKQ